MNLASKSIYTALVAISLTLLSGIQPSNAWDTFVRTNELFAVGQLGSEKSYLYKIDPLSGELILIGDTGLNNCTGLDFTPEGQLLASCDALDEEVITETRDDDPGIKIGQTIYDLSVITGLSESVGSTGLNNSISDISINDSGELFSYENIEPEVLHKHLEENDFMADLVGETGIEAEDHAIAFWADGKLKMAANTGVPALYAIDTESGVTTKMAELSFPSLEVLSVSSSQTRAIAAEDVQFGSMDSVEFDVREIAGLDTRAGVYAFNETDADFVVLMNKLDGIGMDAANTNREFVFSIWGAVGLLDTDTNQVDFIVDLPEDVIVSAITVKPIEPRPIPTMSEWGLIVTASFLFVLAVIMLHRRNKSVSS